MREAALERAGRWAALAVVALFAVVAVRTAWVSDDAYITFRTVDNVLHGLGLTWNPGERVQAYTHPLWMLALTAVTPLAGGPYGGALGFSLLLSLAAVAWVALRAPGGPWAGAVAAGVLVVSKAFTDYATSGLETPLTYLILAVFLLRFLQWGQGPRRLLGLTLLASLGMVNRLDTALLFFPPLAWAYLEALRKWEVSWPKAAGVAVVGLLPLVAWEAFSLVYYGVPFPNTAYAKLGTGLSALDLGRQGLAYLADSVRRDPLTLAAVAAALGLAGWRREARGLAVGAGVLLYLLYVVKIGGDFMSGRFLAAPVLGATVLLATARVSPQAGAAALAGVLALGALPAASPLLSGADYRNTALWHGIADERGYYFRRLGLLNGHPGGPGPEDHDVALGRRFRALVASGRNFIALPDARAGWRMLDVPRHGEPRGVILFGRLGVFAYHAGPQIHVIDVLALTDPFLARLPAKATLTGQWRIGHFNRVVPKGYVESVVGGTDRLADRRYAALYADLDRVIRGPLFTRARWRAVWRLNTGTYRGLPSPPLEAAPAQGAETPPGP
jgi:arabinofuranosyltransferase